MRNLLIILAVCYLFYKLFCVLSESLKEGSRKRERHRAERRKREEQAAQLERMEDAARMRDEWRRTVEEARLAIVQQQQLAKEQDRQRKEQERLAREQERQKAQLERHEDLLMKLDHRLAAAESEIAFNREQIERLFQLQKYEVSARDSCVHGSSDWQKHERKVISLEGQIHTVQKRIDKAKADKRYCESKMA